MNMDGFGPGPAQGPTDLGWAGPAQIGPGPKNFGPNPSTKGWVWIWPSPRPNEFGLGRAEKYWPKPIPDTLQDKKFLDPPLL